MRCCGQDRIVGGMSCRKFLEIVPLRMKNSLADGSSKFKHGACKSFCTELIGDHAAGASQPASQSELALLSTGLQSAHERNWSSAQSEGL